jgi:hypothetical protein
MTDYNFLKSGFKKDEPKALIKLNPDMYEINESVQPDLLKFKGFSFVIGPTRSHPIKNANTSFNPTNRYLILISCT